jgi:2-methylcitrate dehydratase PrpD
MTLMSWAERLQKTRWSRDVVELHLKDTVAAFLAGGATEEGRALSKYYGRGGERTEIAAGAAAIARLSECDDIHLASCVTPGAAVIPVALAFADGRSEERVQRTIAAGYAAGLTLGVGVGGAKALGNGVWPSLLAAPSWRPLPLGL